MAAPRKNTLGNIHHAMEISVGLVELHRGEFGVVLGVHALIAEDASDLIDALHTAHDQTLQRQLGGDAQYTYQCPAYCDG